MFDIDITMSAIEDIRVFRKHERNRIVDSIQEQLSHQPHVETRNRKQLRMNDLAEWELRLDPFRVFYIVDHTAQLVSIVAVGRKVGNRLFIREVEYIL